MHLCSSPLFFLLSSSNGTSTNTPIGRNGPQYAGDNNVHTSNDSATESVSSSPDSCYSDNEQEQESSESKPNKPRPPTLIPFHAKNSFDSTMGGKDLHVLFAMAVGCNSRALSDHKDPPFLKAKAYHSEIIPDAATLELNVTRCWMVYIR